MGLFAIINEHGILVFELGEFTEETDRVLIEEGEERPFPKFTEDPYIMLYKRKERN
jgi:hydrogenase expression/formation protein HypE